MKCKRNINDSIMEAHQLILHHNGWRSAGAIYKDFYNKPTLNIHKPMSFKFHRMAKDYICYKCGSINLRHYLDTQNHDWIICNECNRGITFIDGEYVQNR